MDLLKIIEKFNLKVISGDAYLDCKITNSNLNRPGLEFVGILDYFDNTRLQIIGEKENHYVSSSTVIDILDDYFAQNVPAIIFCRDLMPTTEFLKIAERYKTPVLVSDKETSTLISKLNRELLIELAEVKMVHGVFMAIHGTGVLIQGKSGIGKSEIALELVNRGSELIADDRVDFKLIDQDLIGAAPKILKNKIEVRGLGIIDIKEIYGVRSVSKEKHLKLIIELLDEKGIVFDRIGTQELNEVILGVEIPKIRIPLKTGRNYSTIIEAAVANYQLKHQYNIDTAKMFEDAIIENLKNS